MRSPFTEADTSRTTRLSRGAHSVRARRARGLRPRARAGPLLYILLLVVGAPLAIVALALIVHVSTTEPRDTGARVLREAESGVLAANERVRLMAPVYQRPAGDYFRATRGVLLLTDRRLVHVGLLPRDIFATGAEPDAFVRRSIPIDTTAMIEAGRGFLGVDPAIVVEGAAGRVSLSVSDEDWDEARAILEAVAHRQASERAVASRQAAAARAMAEAARRPVHHVVQRGEALSTIAERYGATVERLREWNGIEGSGIRAGERLIVKPWT